MTKKYIIFLHFTGVSWPKIMQLRFLLQAKTFNLVKIDLNSSPFFFLNTMIQRHNLSAHNSLWFYRGSCFLRKSRKKNARFKFLVWPSLQNMTNCGSPTSPFKTCDKNDAVTNHGFSKNTNNITRDVVVKICLRNENMAADIQLWSVSINSIQCIDISVFSGTTLSR